MRSDARRAIEVTRYPVPQSLCPHCEGGPLVWMHNPNYQADLVCNLCGWVPGMRPDMGIAPEPLEDGARTDDTKEV